MKKLILSLFLGMCAFGLFAQSRPVVVIVPFDAKGVSQDEVDIISEVFLSEYASTGKSTVVDRGSFDKIAAQQNFQLSDWSDSNKVAEMGRALNAQQIITGQIAQFGSQLVCTVKCIDVNTTEVISSTVKRVATMDALFDTCTALSRDIAAKASMSVKEYRIGDKGPAGGIIFAIEGDNRWEVSENLGEYSFDKIEKIAESYEAGGFHDWQIPSVSELTTIYDNLVKTGSISNTGIFWSNTKRWPNSFSDRWYISFLSGEQDSSSTSYTHSVRLVHKFDIKNPTPKKEPLLGRWKASLPLKDCYLIDITKDEYDGTYNCDTFAFIYNKELPNLIKSDKTNMDILITFYEDNSFEAEWDVLSFDFETYCKLDWYAGTRGKAAATMYNSTSNGNISSIRFSKNKLMGKWSGNERLGYKIEIPNVNDSFYIGFWVNKDNMDNIPAKIQFAKWNTTAHVKGGTAKPKEKTFTRPSKPIKQINLKKE